MEAATLLLRLLAILVAARCAAEIAERLRLPAVLVEISAGVVLGPTLLGIVGHDEALSFLGELGAIFLLLEVGLHMDLADLRRVGRSALLVGVLGVILPMVGGILSMRAIGVDGQVALFLAAGITATSVGITARVFADMRSLASVEAQTVLGAAVADDVIGLLILTIVTRLAKTGSVDVGEVAGVVAVGLGFVIAATVIGAWLAPLIFDRVISRSRTEGTLLGGGVAFTLAFAGLAAVAGLAAIVGAFVAGVSLGRIKEREDLSRRLAPVAHLFVPVFFLLIGAEARATALADGQALTIVAVLGVVAVAGKLMSGLAVRRGGGDRLLVGIGMIPRGEVGVVFAALGLSAGVLGAREHAALLFVVLATTMVAPPWLRRRIEGTRRAAIVRAVEATPPGGWLSTEDGEVELRAEPPTALAGQIALDAARMCADGRPGERLLDWLTRAPADATGWNEDLRKRFLSLLREGNPRSWRLLDVTGSLQPLLPELDAAMRKRKQDPFDLDPAGALRWDTVEAVNELVRSGDSAARLWRILDHDVVLVAALAQSAFDGSGAAPAARRLAQKIGLAEAQAEDVDFLVAERGLLGAAAARLSLRSEEAVLELAAHIGARRRADALYLLSAASTPEVTEREALDELYGLLTDALSHPELTGETAEDLVETRRREVARALPRIPAPVALRLIDAAPRRHLLAHRPETIARHVRMLEPWPTRTEVKLHADPDLERGEWTVHVIALDRPGALAAIAWAFASRGVPIVEAWVSTWAGGVVVDVFRVTAPPTVDWGGMREAIAAALAGGERNGDLKAITGTVNIDNAASPWHSIVELRATDRTDLLYRVAEAFARVGIEIHHATVRAAAGVAVDTFLVTGADGHKLDTVGESALRMAFDGTLPSRWTPRRLLRRQAGKVKRTSQG